MELVLVCTSDIACDPDTLAKFAVRNKLLQGKTWVLVSSGEGCALRFAPAFARALGTQVTVNYRWDGCHLGQEEPERLTEARYEVDWFQDKSQESGQSRLKWVMATQNPVLDRLVLVSREVMDLLTRELGLGRLCMARITSLERGSIVCQKFLLEDEVNRMTHTDVLKTNAVYAEAVAAKRPDPTDLTDLTAMIVQTVKSAFQGIRIKAQENPDFKSLLAELQTTLTKDVEKSVMKIDEHYSRSLKQANDASNKAFEDLRNEFKGKINNIQQQVKTMQKQQAEVKAILTELQVLIRSKPASSSLPNPDQTSRKIQDLTIAMRKIAEEIPKLYADLPEIAHKKPFPLNIEEYAEDCILKVMNRKQYTIEGLKLVLLLNDREQMLKDNINIRPGLTELMVPLPDDSGSKMSLVFKQNEQEVCEIASLGVVTDAPGIPPELQHLPQGPLLQRNPKEIPVPKPGALEPPKLGYIPACFPSGMLAKAAAPKNPSLSLSSLQEKRLKEVEEKFGGQLNDLYRKKALELIKDPQNDRLTIEELVNTVMIRG